MDEEEIAAAADAAATTTAQTPGDMTITPSAPVDELEKFWDDKDETAQTSQSDAEKGAVTEETPDQAAQNFRDSLLNFKVTNGDFPADYDPNDPTQFHDSMTLIMQRGFVHQAETLLAPIAKQMEVMRTEFEARIEEALANNNTQGQQNTALESGIPSVQDPHMRRIVQPIYDTALTRAKGNTKLAVAATKRYFKDAGIPLGGKQLSRPGRVEADLDSFFTSKPSKHDQTTDLLR